MKKVLVTGGSGFIGSHLCGWLMYNSDVVCLDNLYTGRIKNIADCTHFDHFRFVYGDIRDDGLVKTLEKYNFDEIYNLACPASPPAYQADPIGTTETCVIGTNNLLKLAEKCGSRFLQASTSEVYGDPSISPQPESYRGNVSCTGIRACYDEGKRCAESLCFDYARLGKVDVRVARIFNTYGENMRPDDGRVLTNMIVQALKGEPITVYGDGTQTRSFCYVDDTANGLITLMESNIEEPVNIGNPDEHTINEIATVIKKLTGSKSKIIHKPLPQDDPTQRKPDISLAESIGYEPLWDLEFGLDRLIKYLEKEIQ